MADERKVWPSYWSSAWPWAPERDDQPWPASMFGGASLPLDFHTPRGYADNRAYVKLNEEAVDGPTR